MGDRIMKWHLKEEPPNTRSRLEKKSIKMPQRKVIYKNHELHGEDKQRMISHCALLRYNDIKSN